MYGARGARRHECVFASRVGNLGESGGRGRYVFAFLKWFVCGSCFFSHIKAVRQYFGLNLIPKFRARVGGLSYCTYIRAVCDCFLFDHFSRLFFHVDAIGSGFPCQDFFFW